jgi:hypothetical protein
LVIATANSGKLREFRSLLAGLPFELTSTGELGLSSPQETGATFLANALLKARHAANLSGSAAVADDSGLEVDALAGAPGIYSARYAGLGADDAANNAKLIAKLAGVAREQRHATAARWRSSSARRIGRRWSRKPIGKDSFWMRREAAAALAMTLIFGCRNSARLRLNCRRRKKTA